MKTSSLLLLLGVLGVMIVGGVARSQMEGHMGGPVAAPASFDAAQMEKLTGLKGTLIEKEGVFKVSYPRSDLNVAAQGVKITPPMGLTCWVAFKMISGKQAACMGDTVLTEDEVNPVMSAALENGLEVTALHNHFFYESPKMFFMHIGGMGDIDQLATSVGKVYAKLKEVSAIESLGNHRREDFAIDPAKTTLDPKKIDAILNAKGDFAKGVYKATFGKTTSMAGHDMGNAMGVNTWAAFVGSDEKAAIMGDYAMLESELQTVLKTLRSHNINVVAIHNHMTGETPRIVFLHYWAIGKTEDLAKGLKAAMDTQK